MIINYSSYVLIILIILTVLIYHILRYFNKIEEFIILYGNYDTEKYGITCTRCVYGSKPSSNNKTCQKCPRNTYHDICIDDDNIFIFGSKSLSYYTGSDQTIIIPTNIQTLFYSKISYNKNHCLFLKDDIVYVTGNNENFKLGLGDGIPGSSEYTNDSVVRNTPIIIPHFEKNSIKIKEISAGLQHSLFLTNYGEVYSCGRGGNEGALGHGTNTSHQKSPKRIEYFYDKDIIIKQISAGDTHSLFLTNEGNVYGCGYNHYYKMGWTSNAKIKSPKLINHASLNNNIAKIYAVGKNLSLFLTNNGVVYFCGRMFFDQVTGIMTSNPKIINYFSNSDIKIKQISASINHTLFLTNEGKVYGCGLNSDGVLGMGEAVGEGYHSISPIKYFDTFDTDIIIKQISTTDTHSLFLTEDGKVYVCGNNKDGQIGLYLNDGYPENIYTPTQIVKVSVDGTIHEYPNFHIKDIFAGYYSNFISGCISEYGSCEPCAEGTYRNQEDVGSCQKCGDGEILTTTLETQNLLCQSCGNGSQPNDEKTQCVQCPDGTVGTDGICRPCKSGTQPNDNKTDCIDCLVGTVGTDGTCQSCQDGTEPNDDKIQCEECPNGMFGIGGSCEPCGEGTYQNQTRQSSCNNCPDGQQPHYNKTHCVNCLVGTAGTGGTCQSCGSGTLPNELKTQCVQCQAGTVETDGSCEPCGEGTYKTSAGYGVCQSCGSGQQPNDNKTDCIDCLVGTAGTDGTCQSCGSGEYQNDAGQSSCNNCPPGQQPNVNKTACIDCLVGMVVTDGTCQLCGNGTEPNDDKTDCIDCPAGTVGTDGTCQSCGNGSQPNNEKTQCVLCPAGMAGTAGHCERCGEGTYQNDAGQSSCDDHSTSCVYGTYKIHDATKISDIGCKPCMASCPGGQYRTGNCTTNSNFECTNCRSCPPGQYKTGGCYDGINDATCEAHSPVNCERGQKSVAGTSIRNEYCTQCTGDQYMPHTHPHRYTSCFNKTVCNTNTHHEVNSGNKYTNRDCQPHQITIRRNYDNQPNNDWDDIETYTKSVPHLNKESNGTSGRNCNAHKASDRDICLNDKVSSLTKLNGASVSIHWDHDYDGGRCIDLTQQTSLNFDNQSWDDEITSIGIPNKCVTSDWRGWDVGEGGRV